MAVSSEVLLTTCRDGLFSLLLQRRRREREATVRDYSTGEEADTMGQCLGVIGARPWTSRVSALSCPTAHMSPGHRYCLVLP